MTEELKKEIFSLRALATVLADKAVKLEDQVIFLENKIDLLQSRLEALEGGSNK